MARNKSATPWEIAKPILKADYLEGRVTDSMKPKEVWEMKAEFKAVTYRNFRTNFSNLKKSIKDHKNRSDIDEAGFLHDMSIYKLAKDLDNYWDGSEAQTLLKQDISKERHKQLKPELLWLTRPQYQKFELKKFRGHIHQELRSKKETNYWIVKKKKKENLAEARRNGEKVNEEDLDFLYDPVLDM